MKKYLTILLLLAIALLSSCNLDNQGIFAEVIDRVPSDNRKLSFIGSIDKDIYFKSINGIECYNLENGRYATIDTSIEAKSSNRFIIDDTKNTIMYFVETSNDNSIKYEGYYSLNLATGAKTILDGNSNTDIFSSSYKNWLLAKNGSIVIPSIDVDKLKWDTKISPPANTRLYGNIDDIIIYSTDTTNDIPSISSLVYYLFDGSSLKEISIGDKNEYGILVSVASTDTDKYLFFANKKNSTTSIYKLVNNGTSLSLRKLPTKLSYTSKKFLSFIDNNNLYFAYDGSTSFYTLTLGENPTLTSTTISKLGNVAIVGYFEVSDKEYKICTANNGFLTLSLDGTPHLK